MSSFLAALAWADERLFCLAYCLDKCESDGVSERERERGGREGGGVERGGKRER